MRPIQRALLAVLLILVMVVSAACGSTSAPSGTDPSTSPGTTESTTTEQDQPAQQGEAARDAGEQAQEPDLPAGVTEAKVVRVIDGDTIEVEYVAGAELPATRIRLIGINTPESTTRVEPYGKQASDYTKQQLEGKTVWLEKDVSETDKYGRALRYVWLTQPPADPSEQEIRTHLFNAVLVLNGYAQVATYPPDVKYVDYFTKFQREAREKNRGLWALSASSESKQESSSGSPSGNKATASRKDSATKKSTSKSTTSRSSSSSKKTSGSGSKGSGGSLSTSARKCDPNYSGACVPPYPPDVDCGDLAAKGFRVVGQDVHGLDRDKDGIACE